MHAMRSLAEEAARAGAEQLRARLGRLTSVRAKSSAMDVVTDADVAAGVAVVRALAAALPEARFVVEEEEVYDLAGVTRGTLTDSEVWVIDPLDGTTSYVHGYPCYSVSVALLRSGQPVAGAVYDIPGDGMFSAANGEGATLNGEAIRVSEVGGRDGALLVTGFPYEREDTFTRQMRIFEHLVRTSHDVRRDGSAAIDCCHVACGRCDAFWELALHPWDMAAGIVILREAGATVTDVCGHPWTVETTDLLASNPALHPVLLSEIATAERR